MSFQLSHYALNHRIKASSHAQIPTSQSQQLLITIISTIGTEKLTNAIDQALEEIDLTSRELARIYKGPHGLGGGIGWPSTDIDLMAKLLIDETKYETVAISLAELSSRSKLYKGPQKIYNPFKEQAKAGQTVSRIHTSL